MVNQREIQKFKYVNANIPFKNRNFYETKVKIKIVEKEYIKTRVLFRDAKKWKISTLLISKSTNLSSKIRFRQCSTSDFFRQNSHKPSLSNGYKRSDSIAIFERTSIPCMNNFYSSFPAYCDYIFIAESENSINRRTPTFYLLSWISPTLLLIAIFTLLLALIVVAVLLYRRFIMKRRSPHGKCPRESKEARILEEWRTPLVFERNMDFQHEKDYTVSHLITFFV